MFGSTRSWLFTAGVSVALLTAGALASEPASLRAELSPDEALTFTVEQKTTITTQGAGALIESRFDYDLQVKSVDDDGADVAAVISRVGMNVNQGGATIRFDSADESPAEDPMSNSLSQSLQPLVGAEMTLHVDEAGQATVTEDSAIQSNPVASQLLNKHTQEKSLSRIFQIQGAPQEVKVGDTWTISTVEQLDAAVAVKFTHRFTVDSIEDDEIKLSLTGEAEVQLAPIEIPEDQKPTLTLHELRGDITWDRDAGMLDSYRYIADFTISGMNPQLGQRVEARLRQDQTLTRVSS